MFIGWIVLGIISCLYGLFVLSANSGTRFYMVWFILGAFCFLCSAAAKNHWLKKAPRVLRYVFFILLGLGFAAFAIVEGVILSHFKDRGEEDLDYLIVLGAQMRDYGPSRVLQYRLDTACEYLVEHEDTLCIVSGGKGPNETITEALGMRDYLVKKGISEDRIILEDQSQDTSENIRNSALLLNKEEDRVGIVTNNFHLFRGVSIAKKQGFRHVYGLAAGSTKAYLPNNMLREFLGVMKDLLYGNMSFLS